MAPSSGKTASLHILPPLVKKKLASSFWLGDAFGSEMHLAHILNHEHCQELSQGSYSKL